MEQQFPIALQALLYVGSVAIIVLAAVRIVLMYQFRSQVERVVRAVEELKAEVNPLAREMRVMVEGFRELSAGVQEQWSEVERIVDTARSWSERANHLVQEVGSMVESPLLAASRNVRTLRNGFGAFVRALFDRHQNDGQQKARAS